MTTVTKDHEEQERQLWYLLSSSSLERAFGDDEPEYSLDLIKHPNPNYEGGARTQGESEG